MTRKHGSRRPAPSASFLLILLLATTASSVAKLGALELPSAGPQVQERPATRTLSAEVLWEMKRLGAPAISPDGRWIVAPVTRYTVEDDKSHTDLWLFASDGSVERPLTQHGSAAGQAVFSPDGRTLAFVTRREGDEAGQIYLLPMEEPGEARRLTEVPTGVTAPAWVGDHIYFISNVWPGRSWKEMEAELERRRKSHMSAHTWNALPTSAWDRWVDETRQAHLFRIPAAGGAIEPITEPTGWELPRPSQSRASYDVSPDGSLVVFSANSARDDVKPKMDLFLVRPGSADARNITPDNHAPDANPRFSPDGRLLAYTSQRIPGFYADKRRLMVYEVATGTRREHGTDWDRSADGLVWAPDGRSLYGAIDDAGTVRVYHITLDGRAPRAVTRDTDFGSLDVAGNGTLVGLNQSFLYPPRLVVVDPGDGATRRLDTLNDEILAGVELGTYESVTYTGANGHPIQMWVHYPPGFDPGKRYPLYLLIHGGPHSGITDGFHFRWNAQTFASWGYVTAWHNFHGSSGFGQAFTDAINPDWLTLPYQDTRLAAQWFASQPWIDPDRMVAGGGSYGGYLSSILLGKEHPFRALVIHAPVYNMYSQMAADFAVHTERFGDYWDHDIYEEISPHYFAGQFSTPALIIHGQLDYRVPVGQAFELFRTLQHRGIESRLVYYPDENHWILKPNNSLYWYEQVREWIEKHAPPGGREQAPPDPYLWLEEVEGEEALAWVEARNARTVEQLSGHPLYRPIFHRAVEIMDSDDRIPFPSILGDRLYNFWQDAQNPRGLWRRTTWDSYLTGSPRWETVLDMDALAAREDLPWAFGGATCLPPEHRHCLVRLSRGGADAVEVREFDATTLQFVEGGFALPEAKLSVAWVDRNTLLVATDFGPESMTTSGYARKARLWQRGTPLEEAALLFQAEAADMGVWVGSIQTSDTTYHYVSHQPNFYEATTYLLRDGSLVELEVPLDASPYLVGDRLLVYLRSPWEVGGASHRPASLLDISLNDFLAGGRHFRLVLLPGERQTIEGVRTTRSHLLVSMLDNVQAELRRYTLRDGEWSYETVPAPELGSIGIGATSPTEDRYFFTYSGYTQPTTLYLAEEDGTVRELQRMPEMFDASGLVVEQHEATSRDGTRIPYFLVRRADLALDGKNPTLLYAYGGFEISMTPGYSALTGASWLERGGVYVVANLRGGGEFGPRWHRAGLKENRQRIYDDFIAVSEDLIRRRITSPERLGIMGGSNGGLLTGVAMTQRPDLYRAIVINVPLLDMRRYNQLLAGASWMAEYGNPDIPEEWEYIRRYSPYHNVREDGEYPKVLFTTTTRDDRVHPGHARKMAALLEDLGHPFHYFENTEGGHGAGVTTEQRAKMHAITYTYLWERLRG